MSAQKQDDAAGKAKVTFQIGQGILLHKLQAT